MMTQVNCVFYHCHFNKKAQCNKPEITLKKIEIEDSENRITDTYSDCVDFRKKIIYEAWHRKSITRFFNKRNSTFDTIKFLENILAIVDKEVKC